MTLQEAVWNDLAAGGGAGGGGFSKQFATPSYQQSLGLKSRGVPDVASDAAPASGYRVIIGGKAYQFGGTSSGSPLWTGLTALICQATGKPIGDVNSQVYPLIRTPAFHDITSGNNGDYEAAVGWDACTGCGTPDGAKLLAVLQGSGTTPAPPPPPPTQPPSCAQTVDAVFARDIAAIQAEAAADDPNRLVSAGQAYDFVVEWAKYIQADADGAVSSSEVPAL